jgi:hypothetical protein
MRRAQVLSRAALLPVRIGEGETVHVTASLIFSADGALLRVVPPPPGPGRADPREMAARRLLARLDAELARPGAPGVYALRQEAELLVGLAEQLEEAEARHGPVVARAYRMAEA